MSGQQIGTAVGFVAGFFLPGGPQVWAAIGGLIGGAIDPTKIEGPHIGDGRQQSANEGEPIAWVLGTAGWIQGNLVQVSAVREIKKEDDGKGGPVTVTYEARQDFCIMAAESSETRNSTIVGVLMVRCNGQIVYDMRPGSNFGAENAKFLQSHVFYYGHEDQMPNPTMEAISGVGNTPAYRGVFTMIGFDVDLTPFGNAIPTYEFVLVGEGEAVEETTTEFEAPVYGRFQNADFPLVDPEPLYTFIGRRKNNTATTDEFSAPTIGEILDHFSALGFGGIPAEIRTYIGYSASTSPAPGLLKISRVADQPDCRNNTSLLLVYTQDDPVEYLDVEPAVACPLLPYVPPGQPEWYAFRDGTLGRVREDGSNPDPAFDVINNCTNFPPGPGGFPYLMGINALYIEAISRTAPPSDSPVGDPCELGIRVKLPGSPGWTVDCDGNIAPQPEYEIVVGDFFALQREETEVTGDGREVFTKKYLGPVLASGDPDGTQSFWESAYDRAVLNGSIAAGLVYGVDYPIAVTFAYEGTYTTDSLVTAPLSVATAIERICGRSGLEPTDTDTSDILDTLEGYPIQADYNGADSIRPLLAYVAGFGAEYDAQIHFHLYGGPIEITIDPLDFVEGSEETDTDTRQQAKEFPRKVSISYIDIDQNYTVRPQSTYRNSPDVRAISEETAQLPLCAHGDRAAEMADISMKVSWARQQGTRKFSVPWVGYNTYLQLVPGLPFALDGKRWICQRVAVDDGILGIEAAYDRQSAYTSIATGVPAQPPTPPRGTIGGVTLMAVMNIPALRDQDDRLGLYVAVGAILDAWTGCSLQMSSDDGATWTTMISSMTQRSTMGYLTASVPDASPYGDDVTNVVDVKVHGGELNSITLTQYLNEANPFALVRTDGTAELMQFLTAVEAEEDHYALSYLSRGRLGSETTSHPAGAMFVYLDSVYFVELPVSLIGRELLFRAVTFGTTPEANGIQSIVFDPAMSQKELAPEFLTATRGMDELTLTVLPRQRFGTPVTPVQSTNLIAYHFQATDGTNAADVTVGNPTTPINVAGWSSPITVTVAAVNRFTGDGFPLIEEIEI